jgi:hypothetical protein
MRDPRIYTSGGALQESSALLDQNLTAEEARTEQLIESGGVIASGRGGNIFRPDGTVKIAIIRPCISRGRRVRGLPPIYTPNMLAENASTFTGWPMFMDHLTEELEESCPDPILAESLRRRARSVNELGGRIVSAKWDPSIRFDDDDSFGFRPGAVVGYVIPQPKPRQMLECDPEILRVSINAYPTGAKPGTAPWDSSKQGMLIEGILGDPPGSVDWVIRAGAGGRVLQESARFAVSLLGASYDPAQTVQETLIEDEEIVTDFIKSLKEMSTEEIRAALREAHPSFLEGEAKLLIEAGGFVSESRVLEIIEETENRLAATFREALAEQAELTVQESEALLSERESAKELALYAHKLIEEADGLTEGWRREIKARYAVLPSGPTPALLVEAEAEDPRAVILENVEADVARALELIQESAPTPTVTDLGGGPADGEKKEPRDNAFLSFMQESGGFESPDEVITSIRKAVQG